ncbi:MAG: tetratricopeptide repeat protein [Desulfobulbaceae bacterium]|nr:tetratricopeptide repeat protein [Desulfobulbaceae bacterium]MDY0350240.1 tetratricopeptide repeat protein [Desulfobulbaceae bacterium]
MKRNIPGFPGSVRCLPIFFCILLLVPQALECGQDRIIDEFHREVRLLAEAGDAEAQYSLAMMYDLGNNLSRDEEKAVYWLRKAAEQDLAAACHALGIKYEFGSAVGQSSIEAAYWYRRAAVQDLPMAQFHLGLLHLESSDPGPDPVQAYAWLTLAAEHGYPEALANRDAAARLLDAAGRARAEELGELLRREIRQRRKNP